jgi:hypothetical protein
MSPDTDRPAWRRHGSDLARHAFESLIPRRCTAEWLDTLSGKAQFGWDVAAMQAGFVDPLYAEFDRTTDRLVPALAVCGLEAVDRDATRYQAALAAAELQVLSVSLMAPVRNGRDARSAVEGPQAMPLSMVATVAFTAQQFAPSLVATHSDSLAPRPRTWLVYRHARAAVNGGIGRAIDAGVASVENDPASVADLDGSLRLLCPVNLTLATDIVTAALGLLDSEESRLMERGAHHLSVSYRLASEVVDLAAGEVTPARELRLSGWPAASIQRVVELAVRERDRAMRMVRELRPGLALPLVRFEESVLADLIDEANGARHE